jgi:hypothetical protein
MVAARMVLQAVGGWSDETGVVVDIFRLGERRDFFRTIYSKVGRGGKGMDSNGERATTCRPRTGEGVAYGMVRVGRRKTKVVAEVGEAEKCFFISRLGGGSQACETRGLSRHLRF